MSVQAREDRVLMRPCRLLVKALRGFRDNQGMLLSGAVAYYTLLSIIPLLIVILIALSHFIDEERLLQTISAHLDMVIPSYAATLTGQVRVFLAHRHVVGVIGFIVMLFSSSLAFTVLEKAKSAAATL